MDRSVIAAELQRIAGRAGKLTPQNVVDEARNPHSPLHNCFEWDDEAAGNAWRLEQAREIIRSVRVEITTESRTISTVYYVRDPEKASDEQGYVSLPKLRRRPDIAREALVAEFARASAAMKRARDLADALEMAGEIEEITTRIEALHDEARSDAA